MKRLLVSLVLVAGILIPFSPVATASEVGGIQREGTVLTQSNSPYTVTKAIEVPIGVTLIVEPGVVLNGAELNEIFLVAGKLEIRGDKKNPVRIQNFPARFVVRTLGKEASVTIDGALISNTGALWKNDSPENTAKFVLSNSEYVDSTGPNYVWYPDIFQVTGNYFSNIGGFSIGMNKCRNGQPSGSDVEIKNNTFDGTPGYTYYSEGWVVAWVSYCGGVINLKNNYFKNSIGTLVSLAKGYSSPITIDATSNYWGSLNLTTISNFVLDSSDSINYCCNINTDNALVDVPSVVSRVSVILQERTDAVAKAAAELKAKQEAELKVAAELKAKQEAEAKAAAELKAKQEAELKVAAELKAKQEAEAKAAAELKAKQEAELKVAAELKAKQEAEAKAAADAKAIADKAAAHANRREQFISVLPLRSGIVPLSSSGIPLKVNSTSNLSVFAYNSTNDVCEYQNGMIRTKKSGRCVIAFSQEGNSEFKPAGNLILDFTIAAVTKKTTITCIKGKLTKKVTSLAPQCPAGYKKK